jgi:hypothetical protein
MSNTSTYVAVAAKISILRADVNVANVAANIVVKTIIKYILRNVEWTKYRTKMARSGSTEDIVVATILPMLMREDSLYSVMPLSSSILFRLYFILVRYR